MYIYMGYMGMKQNKHIITYHQHTYIYILQFYECLPDDSILYYPVSSMWVTLSQMSLPALQFDRSRWIVYQYLGFNIYLMESWYFSTRHICSYNYVYRYVCIYIYTYVDAYTYIHFNLTHIRNSDNVGSLALQVPVKNGCAIV